MLLSFGGVCSTLTVLVSVSTQARCWWFAEKSLYVQRQIWLGPECNTVEDCLKKATLVFFSMLLIVALSLLMVAPVSAEESLVWEGDVYSSGVLVASPVLASGTSYRVEAREMWLYNASYSLAADAQYYTTSSVDTWDWLNHFRPDSHSFLQINGLDVDWGPFSNGDTNHIYSIYYNGKGAQIAFGIVDWLDQNYTNNDCHIHLRIYREVTVGGRVVDSSPPDTVRLLTVGVLLLASVATVPVIIHHRKT